MRGSHDGKKGIVRFPVLIAGIHARVRLRFSPGVACRAAGAASFAPFATRLKAQAIDYQVKLTWKDSPDIKGVYVVYRSPEEITSQSFAKAFLVAKVDAGVEFFIDTPPDQKGYFYAVIVQDAAGTLYPVLIPYRNKTSVAVAGLTAAPEEELAARISGIKAAISPAGDGVDITFTASSPARDLLLFWGTSPLLTAEDLLSSTSTTQLDPGTTRYFLPVFPGVDYWFAVLDAGLYKIGKTALVSGVNTTTAPVQIPVAAGKTAPSLPGGAKADAAAIARRHAWRAKRAAAHRARASRAPGCDTGVCGNRKVDFHSHAEHSAAASEGADTAGSSLRCDPHAQWRACASAGDCHRTVQQRGYVSSVKKHDRFPAPAARCAGRSACPVLPRPDLLPPGQDPRCPYGVSSQRRLFLSGSSALGGRMLREAEGDGQVKHAAEGRVRKGPQGGSRLRRRRREPWGSARLRALRFLEPDAHVVFPCFAGREPQVPLGNETVRLEGTAVGGRVG